MNDLRDRFRSLDGTPSPDLWWEIEGGHDTGRSKSWFAGFGASRPRRGGGALGSDSVGNRGG